MQTFLPFKDFEKTAKCLDRQRLGKQRVEAMQILNTLNADSKSRWRNHPAVRMWRGYEVTLKVYMNIMIKEWVSRGYNNTMKLAEIPIGYDESVLPPWIGDYRIHNSHKCNLYRKDPDYYGKFFGNDIDRKAPYWWPVELKNKKMNEEMNRYWKNV